jgi:catechol 2,3-dioxygenase-like lactoylglutathione lyase family enzyme
MREQIAAAVDDFETGRLSRRQLVGHLMALVAIAARGGADVASAQTPASTFAALGLNHLALRVTDLDRSQRFYEQHLGMTLIPSGDRSTLRLMACGPNVLNLFKADKAEMDHVCFTIADYDPKVAVNRLRSRNLTPELQQDRTHFRDPDGYNLQVGGPNAGGQLTTTSPRR